MTATTPAPAARTKPGPPRYIDGKALFAARVNAGLTQAELGRKVDANQSMVSSWETGRRGCELTMVHKLARALGVPHPDLMPAELRAAVAGAPRPAAKRKVA